MADSNPFSNTPPQGLEQGGGQQGGFMSGLGDALGGLLNLMPGSSGSNPAAGLMVPSWLAAYQQWQNAGKYRDTAERASQYGDPFGQKNREYYQGLMRQSYEDPTAFLNDPGHQAKLKMGLGAVERQNAAKGYMGSGNMMADLSAYTTDLNNTYLDQERARLQPLTGAQFNPASAGEMLLRGNDQAIQSENNALDNLMMPFLMNMGQNRIAGQQGQGGSQALMERLGQLGLNPNSPEVASLIRSMTGGNTPWNNGGYNQQYDANGDGEVSFDEWANGNNQGVMEGLGGQFDGNAGWEGGDWTPSGGNMGFSIDDILGSSDFNPGGADDWWNNLPW